MQIKSNNKQVPLSLVYVITHPCSFLSPYFFLFFSLFRARETASSHEDGRAASETIYRQGIEARVSHAACTRGASCHACHESRREGREIVGGPASGARDGSN